MNVRTIGLAVLIAGSAVLIACGGGGASESEGKTSSSSGASSSGAGESSINVVLSEWTVKPSSATAKAGKVEMKVSNTGATPHELVVVKTDVAFDKLEQAAGIVDETKYKPLGRTKQLNGAENAELDVELTPGKYVLLCNVSGHYGLGMRAAFTVN